MALGWIIRRLAKAKEFRAGSLQFFNHRCMEKVPITPFYNSRDSETPPKKQSSMNMESSCANEVSFTSPRWEKDHITAILGRIERFIPACAGNRTVANPSSRDAGHAGSSPRVRGTDLSLGGSVRSFSAGNRATHEVRAQAVRFIPACAGNRYCTAMSCLPSSNRFIPACAGNRSVAKRLPSDKDGLRFIPACAGNRPVGRFPGIVIIPACANSSAPTPLDQERFIPRVCGEQKHAEEPCTRRRLRFIPACAGNRETS